MKKIALLITVMLLSMVASAQTASDVQPTSYKPVLSEGKCWTMGYKLAIAPWYGDVYNFKETKLEGDTIIGGIRFMREYIKSWTPRRGEQKPEEWTATNSYLGEDGGKVYLCDGTDESIRPIMDFSLGENEIFPMHGEDGAVVTAVSDTILVNSTDKVPRKCMHLSIVGIEVDVWVEGIGSLNNGLDGLDIGRLGAEPMLEKCVEGDNIIFQLDVFNDQTSTNPGENMAYHPFLKEGKAWSYQEYYHNTLNGEQWTKDVSYVIDGTTEIDGKTYYKMYRVTKEDHEYYCALREEDRKVWVYPNYQGDQLLYDPSFECDHLLYDFGMSVGDSYVPPFESRSYQLTSIKPMQFHDDQLLNVFHYEILQKVNSPTPAALVPIVEGVGCKKGWDITRLYAAEPTNGITHRENFLSCYEAGRCIFTADDFNNLNNPNPVDDMAYRPFVEEGKVWKVGGGGSVNPVQLVEYYYFEGDTIVGGKTWKQMMRQRFVTPDYPDYDVISQYPSLSKVGAWYEEDKKVYFYNENTQSMRLMYDFSLGANETLLIDNVYSYIIGPKQTGGMEGFKGVYRDVMWCSDNGSNSYCTTWLEGVGGIDGPLTNIYYGEENHALPLMSCTVGDEVIYLNDEYEDGATPQVLLARKNRFDFTHTIKTRPRIPRTNGVGDAETSGMDDAEESEELSIYGEYSTLQLDINLDPLADAYQVHITNASGQLVYEKTVNAGSIVALSIDISAYARGRYTVTVENSYESFTGEFDTQTAGIEAIRNNKEVKSTEIYNLHGQRLRSLQKGLNIVNGQKVFKSK